MDEVIIGIGINDNKKTWFPMDKRLEMIRGLFADEPRIRVEAYDCLTVDFAKEQNAGFIVRGIRTVHDFEYEETIADINRKLAGIETILLFYRARTDFYQFYYCEGIIAIRQRCYSVFA